MPRKSITLPTNQTVNFTNKALWELIRIESEINKLSISEYVQLGMDIFVKLDKTKRDLIINNYKFYRDMSK